VQLTRLATTIESTISGATPSLLRLFRTQFPRWRILGTLIRHDIARQQITGPPPPPIPDVIAPRDSNFWDHGVWQCFGSLQFKCMDKSACGKRGCGNPGIIVCMCQITKYCSEACKNKCVHSHLYNVLHEIDNLIQGCEGPPACVWLCGVIGECWGYWGTCEKDNIAANSENQGKEEVADPRA